VPGAIGLGVVSGLARALRCPPGARFAYARPGIPCSLQRGRLCGPQAPCGGPLYRRAGINTCPRPSTFGPTCGVPSYPLPHDERFACYVLNTLLRGGMSSRLFQNIRERQGLAYSVFSELNPYRDIWVPLYLCRDERGSGAQSGGIHHQGIPRAQGAAGER
jgi:hypothetical protein